MIALASPPMMALASPPIIAEGLLTFSELAIVDLASTATLADAKASETATATAFT